MGAIFLSGGGDRKHTEKFDALYTHELDKNMPLLYIPIAMEGTVSFRECEKWIKSVFEPLGFNKIEMWTDLNNKTLGDLSKFSALYIGGGNTFLLLNHIRRSGFSQLLEKFVEMGGIVYGGSAGAIILGEDIRTCAHLDENHIGLNEFGGLQLLQGLAVWCHYKQEDDALIEQYIQANGFPVLALSEQTGTVIQQGTIQVTGTKPAFLFAENKKRILSSGSTLHEL